MTDRNPPSSPSTPLPIFMPFAVPVVQGETRADSPVWREIRREGTRLVFTAGTFIDISGKHLLDMYCLEKGRVRILFDTLEGRQRALMTFDPGGIFNLACALMTFDPGGIFNLACALTQKDASGLYQCVKDSVIWRVPGTVLKDEEAVTACPALAAYALRQMGTVALIHSTFLSDMLMDDFVIRFSRYLLSLAARYDRTEFPLGITQDRCAAMLGVHRATLGRAIQHLKKTGVIECFRRNRVCILDPDRLRALAGM